MGRMIPLHVRFEFKFGQARNAEPKITIQPQEENDAKEMRMHLRMHFFFDIRMVILCTGATATAIFPSIHTRKRIQYKHNSFSSASLHSQSLKCASSLFGYSLLVGHGSDINRRFASNPPTTHPKYLTAIGVPAQPYSRLSTVAGLYSLLPIE